jgi:hypothetical protein
LWGIDRPLGLPTSANEQPGIKQDKAAAALLQQRNQKSPKNLPEIAGEQAGSSADQSNPWPIPERDANSGPLW